MNCYFISFCNTWNFKEKIITNGISFEVIYVILIFSKLYFISDYISKMWWFSCVLVHIESYLLINEVSNKYKR